MAAAHRVLPFLETLCGPSTSCSSRWRVPSASSSSAEVRERWAAAGPDQPADVEDYVAMLAQEITEARAAAEFVQRARELLGRYR